MVKKYVRCLFILSFISFHSIVLKAQEEKQFRYQGLRIGADVGTFLLNSTNSKTELLMLADYELKNDRFVAFEGGFTTLDGTKDSVSYSINGSFAMAGMDLNLVDRKHRENDDILYFGLRYGFSTYSHKFDVVDTLGNITDSGNENLSAHWGELILGGKAELWFLKNVFVGIAVRTRFSIAKDKGAIVQPAYIPGYGGYSGGVKVGLTWSLSYRIPFKKVEVIKKKKSTKKKTTSTGEEGG